MKNRKLFLALAVLVLVFLLFLASGCSKSEPKPEPKFKNGQKLIHTGTQKEFYVINAQYEYDWSTGWKVCCYSYDITQEEIDNFSEIFEKMGAKISDEYLDISGGKLRTREFLYESALEPAEKDYRRY